MDFEGIGVQRKTEMFFNIIMPFIIAYSKEEKIKTFLYFLFENHPPLAENRLIKSFKSTYQDIKIENVKAYMGALLSQKMVVR